jgi:membrane fusion protein (multidrug efflux system)
VTPGALVTANQTTALTTVQQLDPIYVDVTQTSEDMLRLKREIESGGLKKRRPGQGDLAVGRQQVRAGRQAAVLRRDGRSGHRQRDLRALFPNPKHDLLPGMFVRAVVESGVNENAIAVPQQGVTRNPKGEATALVLNKEGKVEQRTLVTGGTLGNKWLVKSGLNDGDLLIVEGVQKVKPGAPANAAKPAAAVAAPRRQRARNKELTHVPFLY